MVCKEGRYYSLFGRRYSSDLLVIHEIQNEAEIPLNSSLQSGLLTGSFAGLDSRECVLQIVKKHTEKKKNPGKQFICTTWKIGKIYSPDRFIFPSDFPKGFLAIQRQTPKSYLLTFLMVKVKSVPNFLASVCTLYLSPELIEVPLRSLQQWIAWGQDSVLQCSETFRPMMAYSS